MKYFICFLICLAYSLPAFSQVVDDDKNAKPKGNFTFTRGIHILAMDYTGLGYQFSLGGKRRNRYLGLESGIINHKGISYTYRMVPVIVSYTSEKKNEEGRRFTTYFSAKVGTSFFVSQSSGYIGKSSPRFRAQVSGGFSLRLAKRFSLMAEAGLGNLYLFSAGFIVKL